MFQTTNQNSNYTPWFIRLCFQGTTGMIPEDMSILVKSPGCQQVSKHVIAIT